MSQGLADDWAICGVGLLEGDRRMKTIFDAQDCLYTLTVKHPDGREETSIIGSIVEYLFAPDDARGRDREDGEPRHADRLAHDH